MKIFKTKKQLFVFYLLLFFVVNLLQGAYTELIDDEAYYWLWSKNLDWGYFDHPPMVALWIKISQFFFDGELGVRFFSAFMFNFTLILVWQLIDFKSKWEYINHFFLLITAVVLFNFYGFITVPDTPLFFFVALFLYAYKRFLNCQNLKTALLLGFAMAGMLYSKYHGVLIIFFVLLSHISLLKKRYFWVAVLFAIVLFIPHLLWQYDNGFPSVVYHLNRSKKLYHLSFSTNHFLNQLLIVGLAFPVIYYAFFKASFKDKFHKSLLFILLGFIGFFFISSFKTSTQAQWTSVILIPLIVVSFPYIMSHPRVKKWFIYLAIPNLIILLYIRIALANEDSSFFRWETHNNAEWVKSLKENSEGLPIVFHNSFQNASKYRFYTGIETYSYNSIYYRKNQFDLYNIEDALQGKTIYEVSNFKTGKFMFKKRKKTYNGSKIEKYTSYQHLKCIVKEDVLDLRNKKTYNLVFKLINPYNRVVPVSKLKFYSIFQTEKHKVTGYYQLKNLEIKELDESGLLSPNSEYEVHVTINIPKDLEKNTITHRIALSIYDFPAGFEGNSVKIIFD